GEAGPTWKPTEPRTSGPSATARPSGSTSISTGMRLSKRWVWRYSSANLASPPRHHTWRADAQCLFAAPDRVALFKECDHALLRVVRERVVGHDSLAMIVGLVLGAIDLGVEGALSRGDRVRA